MATFSTGRYCTTYDPTHIQVEVLFIESEDAFVCACCVEDGFHVSMLHITEGGNRAPIRVLVSRQSMKKLTDEICLWCGESVARSFD